MPTPRAVRPLSKVRVLDFGQIILLPFATRWLAWMGAEVILVESRTRPVQRVTPPFAFDRPGPNTGARFNTMNYNKIGCTLNLKVPEAIGVIEQLVEISDVVVENFSPGTMAKLGLDYDRLRAINPRIVYLSASAFGHTGPWAHYGGFHSTVNALSGFAQLTGYAGGPPRLLGAVLPDTIGGIYITLALLVALYRQRETREGCRIDFSMLEGMVTVMPQAIIDHTLNGRQRPRIGNGDAAKAPHGIFRCAGTDRWVAISIATQAQWVAFCEVAERGDLLSDPRFATEVERLCNREALDAAVEEWTTRRTPHEVFQLLQGAGIAAGPTLGVDELLDDPHLSARGFVTEVDHPEAGRRKTLGLPWKLGERPAPEYRHAPLLGEHNNYVLRELLGLSVEQIEQLAVAGAIE